MAGADILTTHIAARRYFLKSKHSLTSHLLNSGARLQTLSEIVALSVARDTILTKTEQMFTDYVDPMNISPAMKVHNILRK